MRMAEGSSSPLDALTTTVSRSRCGPTRLAFSRIRSDGTATTASAAPDRASAASDETRIRAGKGMPGRNRAFSLADSRRSHSSRSRANSVTGRPSPAITRASVVPQVVAPTTTVFSDKALCALCVILCALCVKDRGIQ